MIPMFSETVATNVNWSLISTIVMAMATVGMWLDARKQRKVTLDQPVDVRLVKALHDEFAKQSELHALGLVVKDLSKHNTERHGQLFNKIADVERQGREAMDRRFATLAEDRAESLEKLNEQFQFIRESIVAINTELKIRNED